MIRASVVAVAPLGTDHAAAAASRVRNPFLARLPLLEADFIRMSQDELYSQAIADFGAAIERLARSYEVDSDKRGDLLQEIHLAMWRSFEHFQHQCSLRTWVYRVAHNVGATHVVRDRR